MQILNKLVLLVLGVASLALSACDGARSAPLRVVVTSTLPACLDENKSFRLLVEITFNKMSWPEEVEYTWRRVATFRTQIEVLNRTHSRKFFLTRGEMARADVAINLESPIRNPDGAVIVPGTYSSKVDLFLFWDLNEAGQACFRPAPN